ncbi:hypothetical protein SPFM15_00256 [Salmonella phage SPFM15]|nr:hypothetical protein SPFM5_00251 [Salmonella phage SPFM5]VFR13880.1 hypothetical protein SPFM15_00256 [Salmonella phage SPFM15]
MVPSVGVVSNILSTNSIIYPMMLMNGISTPFDFTQYAYPEVHSFYAYCRLKQYDNDYTDFLRKHPDTTEEVVDPKFATLSEIIPSPDSTKYKVLLVTSVR